MNLIFLPGASGSMTFWHPLIEKLPQQYCTKIIGYPGFGDTPESLEVKSFEDLTNYVVDQINGICNYCSINGWDFLPLPQR